MKKLLTLYLLLQSSFVFADKFHYLIRNGISESITVTATVYRTNRTSIKTIEILPGQQKILKIKLNPDERVAFSAFSAVSSGKNLRSVERRYKQMINIDSTLIKGSNPININIVEFSPDVDRMPMNFGEMLIDVSNNKYLKKILDTANVKISNKIELGSFLLYRGNNLIEPFPATDAWKNLNLTKDYNTYTGFQIKRIVKKAGAGINIDVPLIGKLNSSYGNNTMVDYRWYVKNYKERSWIPQNDNPQTIFKKYPEASGYNTLKGLLTNETGSEDYKIYFVISVSTTDSIKLVADNFVSVDLNIDMNFGLPPAGSKLVKIGANREFYKTSRFYSGEDKGNIYNYFEVMDISTTAINYILEELNIQEKKKMNDRLKEIDSLYTNRITSIQNEIEDTYREIAESELNSFKLDLSFDLMLIIPLNKIDLRLKSDTVTVELSQQIDDFNSNANIYNTYIDYVESKKQDLSMLLQDYQNTKLLALKQEIVTQKLLSSVASGSSRKLTFDEVNSINTYSEENE